MEKIYINDYTGLEDDVFSGNLDTVIENLKNLIKDLEIKGYRNFYFYVDNDYDSYRIVKVSYERLETDRELKRREERSTVKLKRSEMNLEKKRKLFEKLKKEFET
jgi:hypothetical protein